MIGAYIHTYVVALVYKSQISYCKWRKIHWAKLSRFSQFSRALQKFSCESLYKLRIMALFKCCKRKAPQKFSREKLHWVEYAKV